jgi:hypothetical protein
MVYNEPNSRVEGLGPRPFFCPTKLNTNSNIIFSICMLRLIIWHVGKGGYVRPLGGYGGRGFNPR